MKHLNSPNKPLKAKGFSLLVNVCYSAPLFVSATFDTLFGNILQPRQHIIPFYKANPDLRDCDDTLILS